MSNEQNLPRNTGEEEEQFSNVQDQDDEEDDSVAAATIAATLNNNNIGYCHSCDKQVIIDTDSFNCSECHGGFIEIFENDSQRQQANTQNESQRARADPMRLLNETNISNLLPLLLPQLLNQNFRMTSFNPVDPEQSNQQQQQNVPTSGPQTNPPMAQRIGPTTRLQFIVPGEQFDLYGVINNVLSDLLDPRRHGMQSTGGFQATTGPQQPNQFHFQPPPIRMFQLHGDLRDYAWGATGLDTIITQLLNQLENTGPPPATEQQLYNLPLVKITQEEFDNNVQCSICMEDFKIGDEAKKLPCKHYFHTPCITEWLKLHGTCPVCRKNLNGEDTSQREYITPPTAATTTADSATPSSSTDTPVVATTSNEPAVESTTVVPETTTNNPNNPSVYYDMDFD